MSITLSKISMCLFLIGVLARARQWRVLLGVLVVMLAAINLAFALAGSLQCRPLEKIWDPAVAGDCWDPSLGVNLGYAQGGSSCRPL